MDKRKLKTEQDLSSHLSIRCQPRRVHSCLPGYKKTKLLLQERANEESREKGKLFWGLWRKERVRRNSKKIKGEDTTSASAMCAFSNFLCFFLGN